MTTTDDERLSAALTQTSAENRVLAILHRWYTFYEREEKDYDRQLELLTDDFAILRPKESDLPSVKGKAAYLESVRGAPRGQKNAHFRRSFALTREDRGGSLVVTHDFQTEGPLRTGAATLRYDIGVADLDAANPQFCSLQERILSVGGTPFRDAYGENRVEAFVHRWAALIEGTDPEPMRELLAPSFEMRTSTGDVRDWSSFVAWFAGLSG